MSVDKVEAFKEILARDPTEAFTRYGLAMEYKHRGEPGLALEQFDELQRMHPDYAPGYQMAAQVLIAEGKIAEAERRLHAGVECARRIRNSHALAEMEEMLDEIQERT